MVWFLDAMLVWKRGLEMTFQMVIVGGAKYVKFVSQSERGAFFQNQGHPSEVADVAVSMG